MLYCVGSRMKSMRRLSSRKLRMVLAGEEEDEEDEGRVRRMTRWNWKRMYVQCIR